jgi:hypothetical protein
VGVKRARRKIAAAKLARSGPIIDSTPCGDLGKDSLFGSVNPPIKVGVLVGEHIAQMPESLILSHDAQSSYWNHLARGKRNSDA